MDESSSVPPPLEAKTDGASDAMPNRNEEKCQGLEARDDVREKGMGRCPIVNKKKMC